MSGAWHTGASVSPLLESRVEALEDGYVYAEYFKSISSSSLTGTITAGAETVSGALFIADQYPDGIDAIVSRLGSDGRPNWEPALNAGGSEITTDFVLGGSPSGTTGDYALSDTPVDSDVAIVFRYQCGRINFDPAKSLAESVVGGSGGIEVFEQATEPAGAQPGDIWLDTST